MILAAALNRKGFSAHCQTSVVVGYCGREGDDPTVIKATERAGGERKAAEDQAFANKLAKRSPPNPVERAEIEKARKRTKARPPRIAMHIGDYLDRRTRAIYVVVSKASAADRLTVHTDCHASS